MNRTTSRLMDLLTRLLTHRHLPAILAAGAVIVMLPALKTGLFADDLPQRAVELRPDQLPLRMVETGNPPDSGRFSTVLFDLFGFDRHPQCLAAMKNYGTMPWWTPDDLRLSLCRPVAAFTHWLDYQMFPDSPALMHAENIAWYAAGVFVLTLVYRKLMGAGWAAGLAALLFLLDANTYFPVAFVANRGFFLALFFGLLCLYEHHRWRATKSGRGLVLSGLFLALSLLSEEGGASTFAFILAYALVLEPGSFRHRALTLLPSVLVITAWRLSYMYAGYGLARVGIYTDPAQEPLRYLRDLIPRDLILLGSQFTSVPPEMFLVVKPSWYPIIIAVYGAMAIAALAIFLPWARRDKMTAFWFTATILAVIPEAVLVPLSKNFGFIAVCAFGLVASFVASVVNGANPLLQRRGGRILAWGACILLLLVHGPVAIAKRAVVTKACEVISAWAGGAPPTWPNIENENVIVISHPLPLVSFYVPAYEAYHRQPLPKTLRVLVPGCTGFDVQRTGDQTLVIQSRGANMFSGDDLGPVHIVNALSTCTQMLPEPRGKKGDRYQLTGLTVEVLESDAAGMPSRISFRFHTSLDSAEFRWLSFDWRTHSSQPFKIPAIGQSVTISGPKK